MPRPMAFEAVEPVPAQDLASEVLAPPLADE
jgi:hypothetical protein